MSKLQISEMDGSDCEKIASEMFQLNVAQLSPDFDWQQRNSGHRMIINDKVSIRADEDKFGRKVTELRRSYTENDTKPLPTR